jgi:hypothetical protein
MSKDEIITELVELILMQEKEIKKLKRKVSQIKQYIEVYEEYIQGGDEDGHDRTSRSIYKK